MNSASKAFGISLAFHSLAALLALLILGAIHSPVRSFAVPIHHITLVSLSKSRFEPLPAPQVNIPKPALTMPVKTVSKRVERDIPMAPEKIRSSLPQSQSLPTAQPSSPAAEESKSSAMAAESVQNAVKTQPKADIGAEKQSFYARLRTKIQQNLRYPSAARRRGIEGEVDIRFVLENGGTIRNITVHGGDTVFHEAAKMAVASASGAKIPEVLSDTFPSEIRLTLEFRLD